MEEKAIRLCWSADLTVKAAREHPMLVAVTIRNLLEHVRRSGADLNALELTWASPASEEDLYGHSFKFFLLPRP